MKWEQVRLGSVTNNLDSRRKPLNEQERQLITDKGLYPYIGANNIMGYVDHYLFDEEILCIAEDGGSWGKGQKCATLYYGKTWVNNHAHVITGKNGVDLRYIKNYLNYEDLNKHITGTTRGKLTKTALEQILLPLPPLEVQRQIADLLDKADSLRQKDQQLLQKYDDLAQAIFYEMFGDPIQSKKGWPTVELSKVCDNITDGTHFSPPSVKEGIPYITAKHVKNHGLDFYRDPTFVSSEEHQIIYSRCNPVKGDVLYIKDGATTGIAAINHYDFQFSMLSSLALIKPMKDKLDSYYLTYWLNNTHVKEMYIREFMAGAAIKRFTLQKIKQFKLLLPPLHIQKEFRQRLQLVESMKGLRHKTHLKSDILFRCLLQTTLNREI